MLQSKDDLLVAALAVIDGRITARIESRLGEPDPRRLVQLVVQELLPLDAERLAELEVYNALVAQASSNERLAAERDATHQQLQAVSRELIEHLAKAGVIAESVDVDKTALALNALVDGLAIDLLVHPEHQTLALEIVDDFLDSLAPPTQ